MDVIRRPQTFTARKLIGGSLPMHVEDLVRRPQLPLGLPMTFETPLHAQ